MKESFFRFSDPKLENFEFIDNETFIDELFDGFSINNDVNIEIIDEENCEAVVELKLCIGEKTEKYPFFINATMSANFTCDKEKRDLFETLLQTSAPALLFSYTRPIITFITTQAGYPPLNLPFMNFTE